MHPHVLSSPTRELYSPAELKGIFRAGWNQAARVEGWISGGLFAEFKDPACREAWKDALRGAFNEQPPRTALDLGTGPGTIAQLWAELGCVTTGVDFAPAMLDEARRSAAEKKLAITFLEGDAEDPPLQRSRFDVISSRFVLFTLPNPGCAIRRWVQMLRPGGMLVLIGHERITRGSAGRRGKTGKAGWSVSAEYSDALAQLPFREHTAAHLGVVMEAAGLSEVERLPLDELIHMRMAWRRTQRQLGMVPDTPYIVVGRKRILRVK